MSEVTLLTYGGGDFGEYIVFYQDGKSNQEYFKSNTLPNQDQLAVIWSNGDQIDFVTRGKQEWCTFVRKIPQDQRVPHGQQLEVIEDADFDKLEKKLSNDHWSKGRKVTQIVFGDGKWVVLTQKSDGATVQKLVSSKGSFPEDQISGNWDAGFFIKTSSYGNGKYALLFEKGDVPQSLYMDKDYPEQEIEDLWADCYSVSGLLYGDGKWVLISNEQTRNNHQGWVSDTMFPDDDLDELLCAGGLQPKLPPANQVQGVCKTGWLEKKAPANWKSWKRRYFVLSAKKRTCYYYADPNDDKPKGYFFVNGCTVGPCEDKEIEKKHPNTFQVAHPIRRTFYVQAKDQRTRDEWIDEIKSLLDEDYERKRIEIEKFIEDIFGDSAKELEWGVFISRMKEILDTIEIKDEDNLHYVMQRLAKDPATHPTNVVDTDQITKYVSSFGFVEDSFDKLGRVAAAWHGIQTVESAEQILQKGGNKPGSYIVSLDKAMLKVFVSIVNSKGKAEHKTISWDYSADQFFIEEDVLSHDLPVVFRSIDTCMQNTPEWQLPMSGNMNEYLDAFSRERKDYKKREEELRRKQEERLRAEEEAAAAAAAAAASSGSKKEKSKKKDAADDKKDKKSKKGKKKRGGHQEGEEGAGEEEDKPEKGKSKSKKSKKKKSED